VHVAQPPATLVLESLLNKPPLLTVAIALFGGNSYIATSLQDDDDNLSQNETREGPFTTIDQLYQCLELKPLSGLTKRRNNDTCASRSNKYGQITRWLSFFFELGLRKDDFRMKETLSTAMYLANYILLTKDMFDVSEVYYDMGADTKVPVIKKLGVIVVSVLLGVYLLGLGTMAWYAYSTPTWTSTLDSFAMMRLGAAMADRLPLLLGVDDEVSVLDETQGWIGDAAPEAEVGRLELGASTELRNGREYFSYWP
jgi:hypothetical protein